MDRESRAKYTRAWCRVDVRQFCRLLLNTELGRYYGKNTEKGIKNNDIDIETLLIDFSDMQSVKNSATEALKRFPKINGIIFYFFTA